MWCAVKKIILAIHVLAIALCELISYEHDNRTNNFYDVATLGDVKLVPLCYWTGQGMHAVQI